MPVTVLVTGTPGTGKSALCVQLAASLLEQGRTVRTVLVNDLIKDERLYDEYDAHFDTYIVDDRRVRRRLQQVLPAVAEDFCVLETHTVSAVPRRLVDQVVVLSARTDVLYDRLAGRGYSAAKISENMECEIMRVVLEEAVLRFGAQRVCELPSNTPEDLSDNVQSVCELIAPPACD